MTAKPRSENSTVSRVGFVVIGRNEGNRLIRCLDSLKAHQGCEIVYVDSGSTDQSVAEAENRQAQVVRLDLKRPFTAGRARNEGLAALCALIPDLEYAHFVDGDCELATGWLDSARCFLEERTDVAIVCGRRQERDPQASLYNQLCDIEWNTPVGEAEACGGDALVRVASFMEVGGFNSCLIAGEEPELCLRLRGNGWKIWRLDVTMTLHDAAMFKFAQWWMRGVRSGFGYAQVWSATRRREVALYRLELMRALVWAGIVPTMLLCTATINVPTGLALTGIYGLQVARIAFHRGIARAQSWHYGLFAVLAKFPELQGALMYGWRTAIGGARSAILYK